MSERPWNESAKFALKINLLSFLNNFFGSFYGLFSLCKGWPFFPKWGTFIRLFGFSFSLWPLGIKRLIHTYIGTKPLWTRTPWLGKELWIYPKDK
jgi:hypothetical protein